MHECGQCGFEGRVRCVILSQRRPPANGPFPKRLSESHASACAQKYINMCVKLQDVVAKALPETRSVFQTTNVSFSSLIFVYIIIRLMRSRKSERKLCQRRESSDSNLFTQAWSRNRNENKSRLMTTEECVCVFFLRQAKPSTFFFFLATNYIFFVRYLEEKKRDNRQRESCYA